ncbi:MAG: addiction module protein [Gemmataceae bacterium]|nr:addiction module protein [Gemmataceae bacterium]
MSVNAQDLREAALALPVKAGVELIGVLLESIPPEEEEAIGDEEWEKELERRSAELREHPDQGVPWEQVRKLR